MDENGNKIRDFFRNNFLYFFVAFACIAYIIAGLINITSTGKTVWEVLGTGALALLFGFFICRLLSQQGIFKGEQNQSVIKTNNLHGTTVEAIGDYINEMDDWCEQQNRKAKIKVRARILSREGLKYSDYFDDEGNVKKFKDKDGNEVDITFDIHSENKDVRKKERAKNRVFNKALRIKLTPLTTSALTSGGEKILDPYNLGETKETHQKKEAGKELATKIIIAVLFGCYGASLVNFSWGYLIWTILQISLFLIMGAGKFISSYFFVTDVLRRRTIRQIDILQEFQSDMKEKHKDDKAQEPNKPKTEATPEIVVENIIKEKNDVEL